MKIKIKINYFNFDQIKNIYLKTNIKIVKIANYKKLFKVTKKILIILTIKMKK